MRLGIGAVALLALGVGVAYLFTRRGSGGGVGGSTRQDNPAPGSTIYETVAERERKEAAERRAKEDSLVAGAKTVTDFLGQLGAAAANLAGKYATQSTGTGSGISSTPGGSYDNASGID